jgi:hypothetical protein
MPAPDRILLHLYRRFSRWHVFSVTSATSKERSKPLKKALLSPRISAAPYHISRASVLRAVNLIDANRHEEGIALMEYALVAHRETGANYQSSYNLWVATS